MQDAIKALEDIGQQPLLETYRFCTNAAWSAGGAGIPTIGFGPGEERFAHCVEEQVRLADVYAAARVYGRLALEMQK